MSVNAGVWLDGIDWWFAVHRPNWNTVIQRKKSCKSVGKPVEVNGQNKDFFTLLYILDRQELVM